MSLAIEPADSRERPILFSGEMVRAILDGRKRQTRRVVKIPRAATFENCAVRTWDDEADTLRAMAPEPPDIAPYLLGKRVAGQYLVCNLVDDVGLARVHCPYGHPGDRLWVRETFYDYDAGEPAPRGMHSDVETRALIDERIEYRATPWTHEFADPEDCGPWTPSIRMPRWASRLTLEITDVRVERVQSISEDDAHDEGIEPIVNDSMTDGYGEWQKPYVIEARSQFRELWDALNAKRGFAWDVNPWVWVIGFRAEVAR